MKRNSYFSAEKSNYLKTHWSPLTNKTRLQSVSLTLSHSSLRPIIISVTIMISETVTHSGSNFGLAGILLNILTEYPTITFKTGNSSHPNVGFLICCGLIEKAFFSDYIRGLLGAKLFECTTHRMHLKTQFQFPPQHCFTGAASSC